MAKKKAGIKIETKAVKKEFSDKLDIVRASIIKTYGEGAIMRLAGGNGLRIFDAQVPTGSLGLDTIVGPVAFVNGRWQHGIPQSKLMEIFGPNGCGKTTLCLQIIANAQAQGGKAAFIDAEHALDPSWAAKLGVRLEDLEFAQPNSGEEGLQILETLMRSNLFNVIVVDSVAAMVPQAELDAEMGKSTMGSQARLMSQAMRKIRGVFGEGCNCLVIFTNQIRYKVGLVFGNPEITPGGEALKFFADIRIDVRNGGKITIPGTGDVPIVIGQTLKTKVIKNKVMPPFRSSECTLLYGAEGYSCGVDLTNEIVDMAVDTGVIDKNGTWYTVPGGKKFQGKDGVLNAIYTSRDPQGRGGIGWDLYNAILEKVMARSGYAKDGTRLPDAPVQVEAVSLTDVMQAGEALEPEALPEVEEAKL
jgi:recombination protein RecA